MWTVIFRSFSFALLCYSLENLFLHLNQSNAKLIKKQSLLQHRLEHWKVICITKYYNQQLKSTTKSHLNCKPLHKFSLKSIKQSINTNNQHFFLFVFKWEFLGRIGELLILYRQPLNSMTQVFLKSLFCKSWPPQDHTLYPIPTWTGSRKTGVPVELSNNGQWPHRAGYC